MQKVGSEQFSGVGSCPENSLVVVTVAVGIFRRRLRFADAAQPADRLWLRECQGLLIGSQCHTYLPEDLFTSGKEGVAVVRHIPYRAGAS